MLWLLLRAKWAVTCQVFCLRLLLPVHLWPRPLLCGVNSRAAIIAGNRLHAPLHPERRAKTPSPTHVRAARLTDMRRCKHTQPRASQEDAIQDPITWAVIGSEGKRWQWLAHISTQETDRRPILPVDSPSHTYIHTSMQSSSLFMHSLAEPWSPCCPRRLDPCVCLSGSLGVSYFDLNVTDSGMWSISWREKDKIHTHSKGSLPNCA